MEGEKSGDRGSEAADQVTSKQAIFKAVGWGANQDQDGILGLGGS